MSFLNSIYQLVRSYNTSIIQIGVAWILSIIIFATLIVYISKHPQKRTIPLKTAFIIMFLGGMAIYCACHYRELQLAINGQLQKSNMDWVNDGQVRKLI